MTLTPIVFQMANGDYLEWEYRGDEGSAAETIHEVIQNGEAFEVEKGPRVHIIPARHIIQAIIGGP